jgi:hypothetical protein
MEIPKLSLGSFIVVGLKPIGLLMNHFVGGVSHQMIFWMGYIVNYILFYR